MLKIKEKNPLFKRENRAPDSVGKGVERGKPGEEVFWGRGGGNVPNGRTIEGGRRRSDGGLARYGGSGETAI